MAARSQNNLLDMEQLLEEFVGVLKQQNANEKLNEALLEKLGERLLSSQDNLKHDLKDVMRTTEHVRDIHEASSRRNEQIKTLEQQILGYLAQANAILNPLNAQGGNGPQPIIYKVKCPTHGIDVDLEVRRTVTNNNVEYECPLKLSTTCSRGKKLTATWRNHMKKTCVPKLKQCPGHPRCSQGNNNNGGPTGNEPDDTTTDN